MNNNQGIADACNIGEPSPKRSNTSVPSPDVTARRRDLSEVLDLELERESKRARRCIESEDDIVFHVHSQSSSSSFPASMAPSSLRERFPGLYLRPA